ncbi:hypothetical protein TGAM01_v207320 [Trichoderma gamsii]|uniref:Spt20-like SEP domain-containing protein n=1 Tax=Trichoderma gamsii TaxID=398673 RepID=A0A2P4ZHA7_9HYPO|nr:hypothetical protein TGAM01_v207320 [Trichoderma gamsii]PON23673.1 hypothetical protein TGAM01_v207320 [Trichoderma gamsii]
MAPSNVTTTTTTAVHNAPGKIKRPVPPGIQTNGAASSTSSPSPSLSNIKPPSAKAPSSASDRAITASTVRPNHRVRRDTLNLSAGRSSRNSAGLRSVFFAMDDAAHNEPRPAVVTDHYILKKFAGRPPSLVVHLHQNHFRFDGQEGMFQYKSPMRIFLEHIRNRTVPHDLLPYFNKDHVPFYEGCLIVQVYDHKAVAQTKDVKRPSSASNAVVPSSIHNYNQWLTPSPYVPYPKEEQNPNETNGKLKEEDTKDTAESDEKDAENEPSSVPADISANNAAPKPKICTLVLHPTPESLRMDLLLKATTEEGRDTSAMAPPSTPATVVPPTPTASSMQPPAKKAKREKGEIDGSNIYAVEGQILLATSGPLYLEPTQSLEDTIALLEKMSHPSHSKPPPQPKARKRTVAEMAADEAAAAELERYMLVLDDRLASNVTGAQVGGGADGDAATGAATFEPRFERFNVIEDIKREHAEKREQEKLKQQENDRKLQLQRQQAAAAEAAQRQADMERVRREQAQARETQMRQQAAEAQRQAMAARAAASTPVAQTNNSQQQMNQTQHGHPIQNGVVPNAMPNAVSTVPQNSMPNGISGPAQARFQATMSQAPVSSPIVRHNTPQNMSSPMVTSVPMQQTNSSMAASPPRPASVVQNQQIAIRPVHHACRRRRRICLMLLRLTDLQWLELLA